MKGTAVAASKSFERALDKWLQESTALLPIGEERCPACGEYSGEAHNLITCFGGAFNAAASMNSGPWDAHDWQELRRCEDDDCGVYFVTENSNY